ncbi:hypothetical protein CKO28_13340 [Rhodovibrio sodomensis]|uniref:Uncharacterized protein n=1 Tax=Rhodovibrio sodomensis TaxID=1088 RepID=A0ABS1DEW7_9PROT|nr:hypothetical protein [Rhodovibrio sodomensis]
MASRNLKQVGFRCLRGDRVAFLSRARETDSSARAMLLDELAAELEAAGYPWDSSSEPRGRGHPVRGAGAADEVVIMHFETTRENARSLHRYALETGRSVQNVCQAACARVARREGFTWRGLSGSDKPNS